MTEAEWWTSDDPRLLLRHAGASDRQQRLFACAYARTGSWLTELSPNRYRTLAARCRSRGTQPSLEQAAQTLLSLRRATTGITLGGRPPCGVPGEEAVTLAERFAEGRVEEAAFAARTADLLQTLYVDDAAASYAGPSAFLEVEASLMVRAVLQPTGQLAAELALFAVQHYFVGLADSGPLRSYGPTLRERVRRQTYALQAALLREIVGNPWHRVRVEPHWLVVNEGAVGRLAAALEADGDWARLPILGDALEDAGCDDEVLLMHCRAGGEHVRGCWCAGHLIGADLKNDLAVARQLRSSFFATPLGRSPQCATLAYSFCPRFSF